MSTGAFRPNSTCAFYCNSPRLPTESQNQYEKPHRARAYAPHAPILPSIAAELQKTGRPHLRAARLRPQGRVKRTSPQSHTAALLSVDLNLGTVPKLRLERYDSSLRPSSSMASMSASAAAASSPLYSLILGSVPEGRTMALFPPSRPNSMTSALGRPFTHVA